MAERVICHLRWPTVSKCKFRKPVVLLRDSNSEQEVEHFFDHQASIHTCVVGNRPKMVHFFSF